jgi:hypothetical protein
MFSTTGNWTIPAGAALVILFSLTGWPVAGNGARERFRAALARFPGPCFDSP